MFVNVELLILPYAGAGRTVLHRLIEELKSGRWASFAAGVAFAKDSGNYLELIQALTDFAKSGGRVDLTFGADSFAGDARGSEYKAIQTLVDAFKALPSARVFLYHERSRTFHPKVYLFSNEAA